jgi:dihydroflavonol-4-reductase
MKILVTGSTGLIGSRTVRKLLAAGHEVRCLIRSDRRRARLDGLPVEQVRGELRDPASLARAAAGCEACVHLAGVSGWDHIADPAIHDTIHAGTVRLLDAVQAAGLRRFVYVSSAAAIDGTARPVMLDETSRFTLERSGLVYALAKHAAEQAVIARNGDGFETLIVNPAETYGADDHDWITAGSVRDILRGWPALATVGGTSVVHVDDVADGIARAIDRGLPGERYILGGDNLTIAQLVRLTLDVAGIRRPVVVVPFAALRAAVAACRLLRITPPVEPGVLGYLRRYWFVDSGKARAALGYRPRGARETMAPVVRWVRDQMAVPAVPARTTSLAPLTDTAVSGIVR